MLLWVCVCVCGRRKFWMTWISPGAPLNHLEQGRASLLTGLVTYLQNVADIVVNDRYLSVTYCLFAVRGIHLRDFVHVSIISTSFMFI